MLTVTPLEGYSLYYEVRVRPTPRDRGNRFPPEGHNVEFSDGNAEYSLYEEGGLWSGRATRGYWSERYPEHCSVEGVGRKSI